MQIGKDLRLMYVSTNIVDARMLTDRRFTDSCML